MSSILEFLKNNQNPISPMAVDLIFMGIILLFAAIGLLYGLKKGLIFGIAAAIGMTIAYISYEAFGEFIYQKVVVTSFSDLDSLVNSVSSLGIDLKELVYGVVGIVYLLVLTTLSVILIGTPVHFIVKKSLPGKDKLSLKGHPVSHKILNRGLGLLFSVGISFLFGFFLFSSASPALGVFYNPNEIAFHEAFVGEQTGSENEGRNLVTATEVISDLQNDEASKEGFSKVVKAITDPKENTVDEIKEALGDEKFIDTIDKALDLVDNAIKKTDTNNLDDINKSLKEFNVVDEKFDIKRDLSSIFKNVVETTNSEDVANSGINEFVKKLVEKNSDDESPEKVEKRKTLIKKGLQTLSNLSSKLIGENFTSEDKEKLEKILDQVRKSI